MQRNAVIHWAAVSERRGNEYRPVFVFACGQNTEMGLR